MGWILGIFANFFLEIWDTFQNILNDMVYPRPSFQNLMNYRVLEMKIVLNDSLSATDVVRFKGFCFNGYYIVCCESGTQKWALY